MTLPQLEQIVAAETPVVVTGEIREKAHALNEKSEADAEKIEPVASATQPSDGGDKNSDTDGDETIIITGLDAANHLLSLRDDGDPALTFRSLVLATGLSAFQAVMYQIYQFKPTAITISGTFIVLIAHFAGNAWANFLPRGDRLKAKWRAKGNTGPVPAWIRAASFLNHGPWGLKEHAICSITATSASSASEAIRAFTAQDLFYDMELSAVTIVLAVISIGLFGYGLSGLIRPIAVWHVDAVYWSTLPVVKTLQGLHWQEIKTSKPLRVFWIAFACMFAYEYLPAYIWPWLNSVSIPCLAAMHSTGDLGATLTRFFGGSVNNEGLGLFTVSFDWQYVTSFSTSLPLILQAHSAVGYFICFLAMIGIWYTNAWDAQSLPFMSTRLRAADGSTYPISKVFIGGELDHAALEQYGLPRLTGTYAWGLFMANAAIGALVMHCIVFWGKDIVATFKSARKNHFADRHHAYMAKTYKDAPWWWYVIVLVGSFVLGLIVVTTQSITLPWWAFIIALVVGIIIAPLSTILYSRFGNGIATNNLSKMLAGLIIPERPVGNMYFASWSHSVIGSCVNLCNDLKMGEYLKIPPRTMFLTQIYGTVLGGFVNYAVMSSIVNANRDLLANSDGNASWSGATIQSYNTNAASWALAKYLYSSQGRYWLVPIGLLIGAAFVILHRIAVYFVPKIRGFDLREDLNMPQLLTYSGIIPTGASQTCVLFTQVIAGIYVQFFLRNYRPRIFKEYSYLVTGAFDGAALLALFILSFAVFGAGGPAVPFPKWWGNNIDGYYDFCPSPEE